jgi:hypothetical protein
MSRRVRRNHTPAFKAKVALLCSTRDTGRASRPIASLDLGLAPPAGLGANTSSKRRRYVSRVGNFGGQKIAFARTRPERLAAGDRWPIEWAFRSLRLCGRFHLHRPRRSGCRGERERIRGTRRAPTTPDAL